MTQKTKQTYSSANRTVIAVLSTLIVTVVLLGGAVILLFSKGVLRLNEPQKPSQAEGVPKTSEEQPAVLEELKPEELLPVVEEPQPEAEQSALKAVFSDASALRDKGRYAEALSAIEAFPNYSGEPDLRKLHEDCLSMQEMLNEAISEADFLAAGYDCEAAEERLKQVEHWDSIPQISEKLSEYEAYSASFIRYADMSGVSHIFFHSLIADTARAFDGDAMQDGYNLYMTTCGEFRDILNSLYERGYVLVTPYQVAGEEPRADGTTGFAYRDIWLPVGKKPIMMSQDDVNYYGYMIGAADGSNETPVFATKKGDGFASRIVIGDDGFPTCEYMDADGNVLLGDYDLVPILEHFIREHPDFSYRGARAVLGVTAYEGVLGYRTKPTYEPALGAERYREECENAKYVVSVLKEKGWIIASHTYGHPALGSASVSKVRSDTEKFRNTAKNIIGETDILIYPHGSDIAGVEKYSMSNEKYAILYEDGFRYFFNVDNCVAWHQMGDHYFRGNRRDLDGFRMYHYPDSMNDVIDARAVLDDDRPLPVPNL